MSRNQKAPLLAFVLVALVCGLVLVDTIRGEAKPHPVTLPSPAQLGPAYFLAPLSDPLAPDDEESSEASGAPDPVGSGRPDSSDEETTAPAGSEPSGPVGHNGGSQVQGDSPDEVPDRPDDAGPSEAVELWPQSAVPGVKSPIVAFTIFAPDDLWPGHHPSDEPSHEPTTEADNGGGPSGPLDPGHSGSPKPGEDEQGVPTDGPSGATQSADPSPAP